MGKISRGVPGGFSGKVGNIIGATWKGIDYIRIMPANFTNPKCPAQVSQRSKFVTVLRFLQPLVGFLRITISTIPPILTISTIPTIPNHSYLYNKCK